MHETARLTTTAPAQLRSMAHVHVASVDQLTYEISYPFDPDPTTLAVIIGSAQGNAIPRSILRLPFPSSIARSAARESTPRSSGLTDIEQSVMEGIIVRISNMREADR